eukprot:scaffold3537_cov256-Pinguiococcus_pyrenoidosus.AAC.9
MSVSSHMLLLQVEQFECAQVTTPTSRPGPAKRSPLNRLCTTTISRALVAARATTPKTRTSATNHADLGGPVGPQPRT